MTELELSIQSFFGVVDSEYLESITSLFELETIKRGDYFLEKGKQCEKLSFVQSGFLRSRKKQKWIRPNEPKIERISGELISKLVRQYRPALLSYPSILTN